MIDAAIAIDIARKHAEQKGWAFAEPVAVRALPDWHGNIMRFELVTNGANRGTKARFTIDAKTGEIISAGYIPR